MTRQKLKYPRELSEESVLRHLLKLKKEYDYHKGLVKEKGEESRRISRELRSMSQGLNIMRKQLIEAIK